MLNIECFTENQEERKIASDFFYGEGGITKKYIMGLSDEGYAKNLSDTVNIDGFIDDFSSKKIFLGKPILKTNDIDKNSLIVVCSTVRIKTALNTLKNKGFKKVIAYPTFYRYIKDENLSLRIIESFDQDYSLNYQKYDAVYGLLYDETSRKIFTDLLNYRATSDLKYMKYFKFDPIGQYFEDFLCLQDEEVFVDAGGFDGNTSLEFIKHCPQYKSIYIFEPDIENLNLAKKNLLIHENVMFFEKGLSSQKETLRFSTGSGSASSISENGTSSIEVDSLDNLVNERVTFIKMDIEGAEGDALEGMKEHILNDHPKLAISVYHKVDDFWKIPEQILAIRADYSLYLRHYTEGTYETVMFFLPK